MKLFQILGNQVNIVKGGQFYSDTIENYLLDGGVVEKDGEKMTVVVHDSQQNYCEVNGIVLSFPNKFFENIIDDIDTLLAKKAEREYVEPSLEELKTAKILQLKSERDTIQELPIEYNGKLFDYNKESLQKLNEAKDCLEGTEDKQIWICADNSLTYLTYNDIMNIKRLGKERSNDAHIQYAKLKYIIERSETEQEVDIITFDIDTSAIVLEV
jgi:hypothetical protein